MPGDGSIYRRADGRWIAQLSVGGRDARSYRRRVCRTRAEARLALDDLKAERRAGLNPTRLTTGDFLVLWLRVVRDIRPTTRHGYAAAIRYHLVPTIGDVRLASLTPTHVEQALAALAPRMSAKSLRNVHVVLRRALVYAVRGGLVSRNVAGREYVDAPKVPDQQPTALTHDEVRRFLAACRGDRLEALFITALGTG
jgi:site-specific recombinase XerC